MPIKIEAVRCPKNEIKSKGIIFRRYKEKYIIPKSISVEITLDVILKNPLENIVKNLSLSLKVKLYTEAFISYLPFSYLISIFKEKNRIFNTIEEYSLFLSQF